MNRATLVHRVDLIEAPAGPPCRRPGRKLEHQRSLGQKRMIRRRVRWLPQPRRTWLPEKSLVRHARFNQRGARAGRPVRAARSPGKKTFLAARRFVFSVHRLRDHTRIASNANRAGSSAARPLRATSVRAHANKAIDRIRTLVPRVCHAAPVGRRRPRPMSVGQQRPPGSHGPDHRSSSPRHPCALRNASSTGRTVPPSLLNSSCARIAGRV